MNLASYPNLSRAYEIALNGGFTIGITADIDNYPQFPKDVPTIKAFYDMAMFMNNADIMVELSPPYESSAAETKINLYKRVQSYKQTIQSTELCSSGHTLLNVAKQRCQLSLQQIDNVKHIAAVIANTEKQPLIEAWHVAEAVHYVYTHDRAQSLAKTDILSMIENMNTDQLTKMIQYAKTLN